MSQLTLTVVILSASNLPIGDKNANPPSSDPFVIVEYGKNSPERTGTIKKSLNPVWNFVITFPYDPAVLFTFKLYDDDGPSVPAFLLGTATISLAKEPLQRGELRTFTLPVVLPKQGQQGTLTVTMSLPAEYGTLTQEQLLKLCEELDTKVNALQHEKADLKKQLSNAETAVQDAQDNASEAESKATEAIAAKEKAEKAKADAEKKLSEAQTLYKNTEKELSTARDDLIKAQNALKQAQSDLKKAQNDLSTAQEDITRLLLALKNAQDKATKAQDDLKQAQEDLKKTKEDLNTTKEKLEKSESKLAASALDLKKSQDELSSTKLQLGKAQSDLTTSQTNLQKAKEDLTKSESSLNTANEKVKKLESSLQTALDQVTTCQTDLKKINDELRNAKNDLLTSQNNIKKAMEELQKERKRADDAELSLQTLEKQNISLQGDLIKVISELEQEKIQLTITENDLRTEEQKSKQLRSDLLKAQQDLTTASDALTTAKDDLKKAKSAADDERKRADAAVTAKEIADSAKQKAESELKEALISVNSERKRADAAENAKSVAEKANQLLETDLKNTQSALESERKRADTAVSAQAVSDAAKLKAEADLKLALVTLEKERKRAEEAMAALEAFIGGGGGGSGGSDEESVNVDSSQLPLKLSENFQLRCTNCKDVFFDPRVLPCYHSFCDSCVHRIGTAVVCRICQNATRQGTSRPNVVLNPFIVKLGLTPTVKLCACGQAATLYCFSCTALLCKVHEAQHGALPYTKSHKTGLPGESSVPPVIEPSICKQHNKKFANYCDPCGALVCIDCYPTHPSHKIVTIAEAASKLRPPIEKRFTGILLAITEKISKEIIVIEIKLDEKLRFNPESPEVKELTKQIIDKKRQRNTVRLYIDSTIRTLRTMSDIEVVESSKAERWFNIIRDVTPDEFEGRVGVVKKFDKLVSFMTPPPARAGNYLGGVFGDGVVLVTSTNYHQVFFYDLAGNKLTTEFGRLSQASSADGFLYYPRALAVDRNGLFLVGDDYGTGRVQVFDKTGVLRKKIIANGNFGNICSITVDYNTGNIFLGDNSNKKVVVYDADGNFVRKFGTAGSGDKEFNYLAGLAISQNGDVIVSDSYALKVFTQDGIFKAKIGNSGKATGEFDGSMGVVVDGAGNVIVADSGNKRLQVFDSNYKFVQQVITPSQKPSALSIDGEGRLLVVEYDTQYFYILG